MATNTSSREHAMWYLCNGYSRHMTGDPSIFFSFVLNDGGIVTFWDISKGKIVGMVRAGKFLAIENIYLVDRLNYNLLSISQLCNANKKVIFESSMSKIQ